MSTYIPQYPPDYPDRLLIKSRPTNSSFTDEELLFIRFATVDPETGKPSGTDLHCPDMSVNRELYSEASDVLLSRYPQNLTKGFGSFHVREIPGPHRSGDNREFNFRVCHDPLNGPGELENYSHCEIRSFQNEERVRDVPKTVKKAFKTRLAELIRVIRIPEHSIGA